MVGLRIPGRFSGRWNFVRAFPRNRGGQSDTFEVEERQSGQHGVLKIPRNLNTVAVARFRREVEILTSTQHPTIVRLLDWCVDEGGLGYVSPLGIPLDTFWADHAASLGNRERYDTAYRYVRHLAEGLAGLHAQGVVHRDIKPENIIMLSESGVLRPVLIDFGLAIRPGDERLSLIEGRPAANQFAAPPAAYYGKEEQSPAWDCRGLGWIFGWLVAIEAPKGSRFHWKFHPMVDEERRERVRALLAACQNDGMVPADAAAFIRLMEQWRLDGGIVAAGGRSDSTDAERAYIEGQARGVVKRAEDDDVAETCIAVLGGFIAEVRQRLKDGCEDLRHRLPIRLYDGRTDSPSTDAPISEVMGAARKNGKAPSFCCLCGTHADAIFEVAMWVNYRQEPDDRLPFRLNVRCVAGGNVQQINIERWFLARLDGIYCDESGQPVTAADIALLMLGWIVGPEHWRIVGEAQR